MESSTVGRAQNRALKRELLSVEHWKLIVVGGVSSNIVVLLVLNGERRILGFGESCLPDGRRRGNVATILYQW
jgi:hypothetical protein